MLCHWKKYCPVNGVIGWNSALWVVTVEGNSALLLESVRVIMCHGLVKRKERVASNFQAKRPPPLVSLESGASLVSVGGIEPRVWCQ